MSVVINTNYAATAAANNLAASNVNLQKSLNRLSSGSKIVTPSDDAGGLAVSMKLSATAKQQGATISILGNGVSFLQTQDGALKVAGEILQRIAELGTLAGDPTKSPTDISNYDTEFTALKNQLSTITGATFNNVTLFGSGSLPVPGGGTLSKAGLATAVAGVTSAASVSAALGATTTAIETVATERAENGAEQSNFNFAAELLTVNKANLEAANSRISDVDVAEESTQLARWNILVQSGTAMLSQANQSAQIALKLLQ
jgi:flagellin